LIENAIKYAKIKNHPHIHINIASSKKNLVISIADNGMGIKKENYGKIFDMFFRSHKEIKGTGLGLYLLKSAVDKLKGKVSFESRANIGATFKVTLPTNSQSLP